MHRCPADTSASGVPLPPPMLLVSAFALSAGLLLFFFLLRLSRQRVEERDGIV